MERLTSKLGKELTGERESNERQSQTTATRSIFSPFRTSRSNSVSRGRQLRLPGPCSIAQRPQLRMSHSPKSTTAPSPQTTPKKEGAKVVSPLWPSTCAFDKHSSMENEEHNRSSPLDPMLIYRKMTYKGRGGRLKCQHRLAGNHCTLCLPRWSEKLHNDDKHTSPQLRLW